MRYLVFTLPYWKDLAERVIASAVGAVLAYLGVSTTPLLDLNWNVLLTIAGGAALASLLKGLAATWVGDANSASLAKAVPATVHTGKSWSQTRSRVVQPTAYTEDDAAPRRETRPTTED